MQAILKAHLKIYQNAYYTTDTAHASRDRGRQQSQQPRPQSQLQSQATKDDWGVALLSLCDYADDNDDTVRAAYTQNCL